MSENGWENLKSRNYISIYDKKYNKLLFVVKILTVYETEFKFKAIWDHDIYTSVPWINKVAFLKIESDYYFIKINSKIVKLLYE